MPPSHARAALCLTAALALAGRLGASPPAGAAAITVLDPCTYASAPAAAAAWIPKEHTPAVGLPADGGGVEFPCPSTGTADRLYWDHPVRVNLEACTSVEVELYCDHPEALATLDLYLKSGAGWYLATVPLPAPGRHRLVVLKDEFRAEGAPRGWAQVEAVRLSLRRGAGSAARLICYRLAARVDTLLVVQGTASVAGAGEQGVARKTARQVSAWLRRGGVAHGFVTDEAVSAGALESARVAVLPYNPAPPARELKALGAFLQRGGRLLVCYGNSPELAQMMHFKLGPYQRAATPGRWSSWVFPEPAAWPVPERVLQESDNLLPVYPADDTARVIAWWENRFGTRQSQPAWVASAQGAWMSHILLPDDALRKQSMLLGLLGRYDPDVWSQAARQALFRAGCIASAPDYRSARALVAAPDAAARVPELLASADRLYAELPRLFAAGRYAEVVSGRHELDRTLTEAYALGQQPRPGEFRGVWEHDGLGWYPGDWERTCRELAAAGINALFPNMLWAGLAHYPSDVLPRSTTFLHYGDQLAAALKAARQQGLQCHAWFVCWNLGNAPADFVAQMKKAGRLQQTSEGQTIPWLSPSHPDNVALALAALEEVARRYPVDGLHLDYIRYSNGHVDFSPAARRAFERRLGHAAAGWPQSARPGGPLADDFQRFRAEQITAFVRAARERLNRVRPGLKLSAAVYAGYPECVAGVGQDWAAWLKGGLVDFVCPMNYTADLPLFAGRTAAHVQLPGAAGRVYPGLGISADESQLRPDQAIEQIVALRKLGAAGFMLFDCSRPLRDEILPLLRLGVTRKD
ncbi:MAG: family 10 glycosylhydrolase [Kiritimatiellaeota bacterium]|nr:family 10 glycosylhydrolase [Kiritimatiellota bacterium]